MVENAAYIAFFIMIISFFLAFYRLLKGPTLPDRIISLDLIFLLTIGIVIIFIFISKKVVYLDIAPVVALIVFLGTVTISKYLKVTRTDDD
ncbi:MAG: monovalent cation/H+ antiporter complex subunit F [Candidatus Cyclobacteriaceae bacterium M2_1C_046]